jgi:hypothetical protein
MKPAYLFLLLCSVVGVFAATSPDDAHRARIAALRHVMLRGTATTKEKEASRPYVLEDTECVSAFTGFVHEVIPYSKERFPSRWVDRTTGKLVRILKIELSEVDSDTARIAITVSSGKVGLVGHIVRLKKKDGIWTVVSMDTKALAENVRQQRARAIVQLLPHSCQNACFRCSSVPLVAAT